MSRYQQQGMTMIELMIVIAIIAILASAATTGMQSYSSNGLADRIYRELELDFRFARDRASTTGKTISFEPIDDWKKGWKIKDGTTVIKTRKFELEENTIKSDELDTSSPLEFTPQGRTSKDVKISISVPNCSGLRKRELIVNRIGQVILSKESKC